VLPDASSILATSTTIKRNGRESGRFVLVRVRGIAEPRVRGRASDQWEDTPTTLRARRSRLQRERRAS